MSILLKGIVIVGVFSLSIQAIPKTSPRIKTKPAVLSPSLIRQAQQEIAVDPNLKEVHATSPQDTGVLVVRAPDLSPNRNPSRFPVGIRIDTFSLFGTAIAANKNTYEFSDLGNPIFTSLELGMVPGSSRLFDSYNFSLGLHRKSFSYSEAQSLNISHTYVSLSAQNNFYRNGKMDFCYLASVGAIQSQISSPVNSLANITRKINFFGLGLQSRYSFIESLNANVSISYNYAFARSAEFNIQPIGFGAGVSYVW